MLSKPRFTGPMACSQGFFRRPIAPRRGQLNTSGYRHTSADAEDKSFIEKFDKFDFWDPVYIGLQWAERPRAKIERFGPFSHCPFSLPNCPFEANHTPLKSPHREGEGERERGREREGRSSRFGARLRRVLVVKARPLNTNLHRSALH